MFKTRVKKRIDRIKQVGLLHILYHTHLADLGTVLQMKHGHKFQRESLWARESERERAKRLRDGEEEEEDRREGERRDGIVDKKFCYTCMIK